VLPACIPISDPLWDAGGVGFPGHRHLDTN
jgi:hypothetical protein